MSARERRWCGGLSGGGARRTRERKEEGDGSLLGGRAERVEGVVAGDDPASEDGHDAGKLHTLGNRVREDGGRGQHRELRVRHRVVALARQSTHAVEAPRDDGREQRAAAADDGGSRQNGCYLTPNVERCFDEGQMDVCEGGPRPCER